MEKEYLEIKEKIVKGLDTAASDISLRLSTIQAGSDICHDVCSDVINMLTGVLTVMPLIPDEDREKFVVTNLKAIRSSMYAKKRAHQVSLSSAKGQVAGLHASRDWVDSIIDQCILEKKAPDELSSTSQEGMAIASNKHESHSSNSMYIEDAEGLFPKTDYLEDIPDNN